MYQIAEQTYEEKFEMYSKLSKRELISMLIEANKHLSDRPLTWSNGGFYNKSVTTFAELCSCNPANGGSGICGCTMANKIVK